MKKFIILFFLSFIIVSFSFSQTDTVKIENVVKLNAKAGDTILVPVTFTAIAKDSVTSIFAYFIYDNTALNYIGFEKFNNFKGSIINAYPVGSGYDTINNTMYSLYGSGDTIAFECSLPENSHVSPIKQEAIGISPGTVALFDIQFSLVNAATSTTLCFTNGHCAIDDFNAIPYTTTWVCGSINTFSDGISKVKADEATNIYPNPSDGHFELTGINGDKDVSVFDVNGGLIYDRKVSGYNNSTYLIDISNYSTGIYMLRITGNDNVTYKKLIIE